MESPCCTTCDYQSIWQCKKQQHQQDILIWNNSNRINTNKKRIKASKFVQNYFWSKQLSKKEYSTLAAFHSWWLNKVIKMKRGWSAPQNWFDADFHLPINLQSASTIPKQIWHFIWFAILKLKTIAWIELIVDCCQHNLSSLYWFKQFINYNVYANW